MFKASSDAQFDYYEVKLQLDNEKISWYFEIQAGAITCYYDFRGVVKRPDEHYNFVLIPGFDTPDWAKRCRDVSDLCGSLLQRGSDK